MIVVKTVNRRRVDIAESAEGDGHYVQAYASQNNGLDKGIGVKTVNCCAGP